MSNGTLPSQIQALQVLFNSTQGGQWRWKNEGINGPKWSFSSPQADPCNDQNMVWQGILCSATPNICALESCQIVSLTLNGYNLTGSLPFEFFVLMSSLTTFEISLSRGLFGTIPSEIGCLSHLGKLSLEINQLTGIIPSALGSLSELVSVTLYDNQLIGTIPTNVRSLSLLESLNLGYNQLTGTIPSEIGFLSHLVRLYVGSNQIRGILPSEIGSLSRLLSIILSNNQLTGTIPSTIASLSELASLFLNLNRFSGTIPPEIGSLSQLEVLFLGSNQFTGHIPTEIGFLSQLLSFAPDHNQLTGPIPSEIGSLSRVVKLFLDNNQFTESIPSEIGSLSRLGTFYLYNNQITGAIPSEIGSLSQLDTVYLNLNLLSGFIPSEIGSLSRLVSFSLEGNQLSGPIPSQFGSLSQLASLYLSANQFSGSIPTEVGSLSQFAIFYLAHNQITGSLPSSFSKLSNLVWLHAYDNHLNGQITFPLASLPKLKQLFLHRNHFTGSLQHLFSSSPAPLNESSSELLNLDVSDNLFSGTIPPSIFLPHLQSISLSSNCFEHELPSSICEAKVAGVISMDGLGSAKGCKNVFNVPFTSVFLVRSLNGNIPDCVWSMPHLRMLNLAGNGLNGRIRSHSAMLSLLSLTLSHNYLSGEIPLWLQQKNLSHLDLSHNKFTGDASGFQHQHDVSWNSGLVNELLGSQYLNRSLTLTVNRLSGNLPGSFGNYASLDILSGNLFGCANLPKNDENSASVSCGSEDYNHTLMLMGGVLGSLLCLMALPFLMQWLSSCVSSRNVTNDKNTKEKRSQMSRFPLYHMIICSFNFLPSFVSRFTSVEEINTTPFSTSFPSTRSFGNLIFLLIRSECFLTILCLLFSLPIYVLKQLDVDTGNEGDPQYVTHSHQYNWLWTSSFLSGAIPAIILLLVCLVCLSYWTLVIDRLGEATDPPLSSQSPPPVSKEPTSDFRNRLQILTLWMIFILNAGVVGTVNGLYVWSTLLDLANDIRIWIQFSVGLFTFVWGVVLRRGLPLKITESNSGVWLFTCLNVMNSVIIPCFVTALSSPSCYQRLLVPPDDISSSYSYQACLVIATRPDGSPVCLQFIPKLMDILRITPPFFYNYQCGSTLLTSYIPVYMYSVSIQLLSSVASFSFIILSTNAQHPAWLRNRFSGVCWPSRWSNVHYHLSEMNIDGEPIRLINPHQIISRMMNNIVLLLSFGLCSPVLCCYITLSSCVHLSCWLILIGRFVCHRIDILDATRLSSSSRQNSMSSLSPFRPSFLESGKIIEDQLLLLLDQQLHGVTSSLLVCKWPIILTSCFFVTLLCWDMAGDQGGWLQAVWVPIAGVVIATWIWVWDRVLISSGNAEQKWILPFLSSSLHQSNHSLEIVHSSLHQSPFSRESEARVDEEFSVSNKSGEPTSV